MAVYGIGEVPMSFSPQERIFLTELRNAVLQLQPSSVAPRQPSNFTATGKAGGVLIQFTASDADSYTLFAGNNADFSLAVAIDLAAATSYTDNVGKSAVTRYYWVRGVKAGNLVSSLAGPVLATTLGLAVEITPPAPPPASDQPIIDDSTGNLTREFTGRYGY